MYLILPLIIFGIHILRSQNYGTDFMVNIVIILLIRINWMHIYVHYQHVLPDLVKCQDNGTCSEWMTFAFLPVAPFTNMV